MNFEMTMPDDNTPSAENANATVPVTRLKATRVSLLPTALEFVYLEVDADCLYCVSMYFGVKIQ